MMGWSGHVGEKWEIPDWSEHAGLERTYWAGLDIPDKIWKYCAGLNMSDKTGYTGLDIPDRTEHTRQNWKYRTGLNIPDKTGDT